MSSGGQTGTALSTTHTNLTADIIEARVRQITSKDSTTLETPTDIDTKTAEVCRDISKRALNLKNSSTGTLAADANTITIPSDMIPSESAIDELYLGTTLLDPITFAEWRAGKMSGYIYWDGVIYINPTSNSSQAYTLYYRRYHTTSVAAIEHNDDFKMAIVYGVCQHIYEDYQQSEDKGIEYMQKFEYELQKNMPAEIAVCRMRSFRE